MEQGTVKWFDNVKGFGYIIPDIGGRDLFVHYSHIDGQGWRTLTEGQRVQYTPGEHRQGPVAQNVQKIGSAVTTNRSTNSAASDRGEYQRLLVATASLVLTRGYAGTSVGRICVRANTTPARFGRHLGRKYDAAHEVAAHLTRHAVCRIDQFTPRDGEHLLATLTIWTRLLITRPDWVWLELDLTEVDTLSRSEVFARVERLRQAVTKLLARSPGPVASERSGSELEQLVSLLFTIALGMAIQHSHGTTFTSATLRAHLALALSTNHP